MSADHQQAPRPVLEWIGPYRVLSELGAGGMGRVYKARSPEGRLVAVKVVRPEYAATPEFRHRFEREVRNAERVPRYWTAEVFGASLDGDLLYLVTEFIGGRTLNNAVARDGPWSGARLEQLGLNTAAALSAIHRAGMVHRDLKPSNILLSESGPRVIDFGIARAFDAGVTTLTATGQVIGTPGFIAPEVHSGRAATPAADVFAWGGVMVYAATGRYAFGSDHREAVVERVVREAPDLSGLDGTLLGAVADALAKDPTARPTPEQLQERLTGVPAPAPPAPQQSHVTAAGWVPPALDSSSPPSPPGAASPEEWSSSTRAAPDGVAGPDASPGEPASQRQRPPAPEKASDQPVTTRPVRWRRLRPVIVPSVAALLLTAIVAVLTLRESPDTEPERAASIGMSEQVDRLDSDRIEVKIDAILALERIARQDPAKRLAVFEVLTAYLHRRVPYPPDPQRSPAASLINNLPGVQTVLTVLGRRPIEPTDPRLDLSEVALPAADLSHANLSRALLDD